MSDIFADWENEEPSVPEEEMALEPKAMSSLRNAGRETPEKKAAIPPDEKAGSSASLTAASKADNAWMDHIVGLEDEPPKETAPAAKESIPVPVPGEVPAQEDDEAVPEETVKDKTESTRKKRSTPGEISEGIASVEKEIEEKDALAVKEYVFPSIDLLQKPSAKKGGTSREELAETAQKLQEVFATFGVNVKITNVTCGPSVTRFELTPADAGNGRQGQQDPVFAG